jgi:hypothetical protein
MSVDAVFVKQFQKLGLNKTFHQALMKAAALESLSAKRNYFETGQL